MELKDKKILVVGLGKTGLETALFLNERGAEVRVSDASPKENLEKEIGLLSEKAIDVESGGHTEETFLWPELIVLSPGVPFSIPEIKRAQEEGIDVISEVELASKFITKPIIAVTGSNGKTTTCSLIAEILEKCGKKVFLGANIGTPLITIAGKDEQYDVLVLELSSFQLQGVSTLRPDISVLLNISPNHLDHHESYEEYIESKMNIAASQIGSDYFIYKSDDEEINKRLSSVKAKKIPFGNKPSENGVFYNNCCVIFEGDMYELFGMKLMGMHNIDNVMAAIAATRLFGCEPSPIRKAILDFEPLPHRNEYLGRISGAHFYNDSKSTSPGATLSALKSMKPPVILIAGGKDKGVSYRDLIEAVNEKVKLLVLIGEARQRMDKELSGEVPAIQAESLEGAIDVVIENIEPRDTVLFSPACSSFDMFSSYEERGRRYKEIVENIPNS